MKSLHILSLGKNSLTSLEKNQFSDLKSLKTLDLTGNKLASMHPTAFSNMTSLEKLYLNDNQLTSISPLLFNSLNLKSLDMSYERLSLKIGQKKVTFSDHQVS